MLGLTLRFTAEDGSERAVTVDTERFTIGRHSASDLSIVDSRLSREHAIISRTGNGYVITDAGSSNGTTLNGEEILTESTLRNGDRIGLGGGPILTVEIGDSAAATVSQALDSTPTATPVEPDPLPPPAQAASASGPGIPVAVFFVAPLLGLLIIGVAVAALVLFGPGRSSDLGRGGDDVTYSDSGDDVDDPPIRNGRVTTNSDDTPATTGGPSPTSTSEGPAGLSGSGSPGPQSTPPATDTTKVEQNGAAFLRRIAQNDPKAFLTTDQAGRVNTKIKQVSRSSGLADNIASARKNAAQIRSIAVAKRLKPQFLAVAAISSLGSSRGDVVQTAQRLADVYDKLSTQIGSELADDTLLMVAAYDQGAAGDYLKMRNMLQDLSNKYPESSRAIRSIWFLEKQGKITGTEFDSALGFLAVGVITQNPKDFGVNTEPLIL